MYDSPASPAALVSVDLSSTGPGRCPHRPACPGADSPDHEAARVVSRHPEQGWNLLCNGVVLFDDTGELLPDGQTVDPHRPACHQPPAA